MVANMKLAFTNVPFKHNLACVMIKKWLRFKRVIPVRLDYSQTCIKQPLLGPLKSGRLGQVVIL